MAVIQSLTQAVSTIRANPVILFVGFAYALLTHATSALQLVDPNLSTLASFGFLFVYPFVFAGLVGMIDTAFDGPTSLDRFFEDGRSYYASVLGASLLIFVGMIGTMFVFSIVLMITMFAAGGAAAAGGSAGLAAGAGLVGVAVALIGIVLFLLAAMFLQFVVEAIVLDGADAVGSFSESVGLVRRNFVSVLGFSVLAFVLYLVLLAPAQAVMFASMDMSAAFEPSQQAQQASMIADPTLYLAGLGLGVVLMTISISLLATYHVGFYRSLRGPDAGDGAAASEARAAA